ncbi:MAG: transcriptional regulator, partial [Alcaligenaceae bacterium]
MLHTTAEQEALQQAQAARKHSKHQGRKLRYEGTRMACPMCKASSEIRTSYMPSETMRETFY